MAIEKFSIEMEVMRPYKKCGQETKLTIDKGLSMEDRINSYLNEKLEFLNLDKYNIKIDNQNLHSFVECTVKFKTTEIPKNMVNQDMIKEAGNVYEICWSIEQILKK